MKEVNGYYKGYSNSTDRLNFLKFGVLNEFGLDLGYSKKYYHEDDIVKHKCKKIEINNKIKK